MQVLEAATTEACSCDLAAACVRRRGVEKSSRHSPHARSVPHLATSRALSHSACSMYACMQQTCMRAGASACNSCLYKCPVPLPRVLELVRSPFWQARQCVHGTEQGKRCCTMPREAATQTRSTCWSLGEHSQTSTRQTSGTASPSTGPCSTPILRLWRLSCLPALQHSLNWCEAARKH